MTEYKILACDLDETLLDDDHLIPQNNIDAIQKARLQKGLKFIPATGRGFMTVQRELKWLGLHDLPGEYILSYNGGAITENKDNRLLYFKGLPFEKVNEIAQFAKSYDVGIHIYTRDMIYVYRLNEIEKARKDGQGAVYTVIDSLNLDFLREIPVAKVLLQKLDMPYLQKIAPDFAPITDDGCSVSFSSGRYMEINAAGIDKGKGLHRIAEITGIPTSQMIAAGDNFNDIPMLKEAGLAVCPSNAVDAVKQICGYVAHADNNQGAIAEVIERFIL